MKEALTSYEKLLKFVELDSMSLYSKLRLQCALVRVGILYLIPYLPALSLDGQRVAPPLKTPIRTRSEDCVGALNVPASSRRWVSANRPPVEPREPSASGQFFRGHGQEML